MNDYYPFQTQLECSTSCMRPLTDALYREKSNSLLSSAIHNTTKWGNVACWHFIVINNRRICLLQVNWPHEYSVLINLPHMHGKNHLIDFATDVWLPIDRFSLHHLDLFNTYVLFSKWSQVSGHRKQWTFSTWHSEVVLPQFRNLCLCFQFIKSHSEVVCIGYASQSSSSSAVGCWGAGRGGITSDILAKALPELPGGSVESAPPGTLPEMPDSGMSLAGWSNTRILEWSD